MAVAARELQYRKVPSINRSIATTRALNQNGQSIGLSWYGSKLWVNARKLSLPRSKQWSESRIYFAEQDPEIAADMLHGINEWTDSLVALPNYDGRYASSLNPKPKSGRYPLLIEGSNVEPATRKIREKTGNEYVIEGGERRELPIKLVSSDYYLEEDMPELGLIKDTNVTFFYTDPQYEQGLRVVTRGHYVIVAHGVVEGVLITKLSDLESFRPMRGRNYGFRVIKGGKQ